MLFFRKKRLFLILIGIIVLVVLVGYSLNKRGNLSTPEQFIKDTVGWMQNVIYTPIKFVTNITGNLDDIRDTYKENKLLKEKLANYKGLIYKNQEIEEENKELHKLLGKTKSIRDFKPIQATVLSRSPERWVDQVTINKGKHDGVKRDMAVITADGMVGKVKYVTPFTSTVQLLTGFDQLNRISAKVSRKKGKDIVGLVEEYDEETNSLLFRIMDESGNDLKKGELVMSSGMGGVFPAGLTIGKVKKVIPDKYGLTRTALVKPAADMYEISNVIVVNRSLKDVKPQKDEGDKSA